MNQETENLLNRVKIGNDKLFHAWEQIRDMDRSTGWNEQMDKLSEASKKLSGLCHQLKLAGYNDCLYIIDGKRTRKCLHNSDGFWCQVCSSDIKYWEAEIMEA